MKKLLFIILLSLNLSAFAQHDMEENEGKNEKIEALKIGFITEKLELSTKEAELFWPIYNKFNAEVRSIRKSQRTIAKKFKSIAKPTELESDKFISEQLQLKQAELDVAKKYIPEFKKVISATKVAKLLNIEHEFKVELLKKIKERREPQH
ncbi:MAG: hypothetical protein KBE91_03690 [Bacteroidia bacterium]|nr:hypothetical protein [Bacteroidia bacterium]